MRLPSCDQPDRLDRADLALGDLLPLHTHHDPLYPIGSSRGNLELERKRNPQGPAARNQAAEMQVPERRSTISNSHGLDQRGSLEHWANLAESHHALTPVAPMMSAAAEHRTGTRHLAVHQPGPEGTQRRLEEEQQRDFESREAAGSLG